MWRIRNIKRRLSSPCVLFAHLFVHVCALVKFTLYSVVDSFVYSSLCPWPYPYVSIFICLCRYLSVRWFLLRFHFVICVIIISPLSHLYICSLVSRFTHVSSHPFLRLSTHFCLVSSYQFADLFMRRTSHPSLCGCMYLFNQSHVQFWFLFNLSWLF